MEVIHPRCAGLDVHSETIVACTRLAKGRKVTREKRTFGTTTSGLLELADWLETAKVKVVAMESTGVYWKPVWHILAERFQLVLGNAMHIRNIPGRKSDVSDAEWIADLIAHGLIRSSFVPPPDIQELRDLTRTRKQIVHEVTRHKQRIQKTLEDTNLKATNVMSDLFGVSGRRILAAIVAGQTDAEKLADLSEGRLKASRTDLVEALRGRITPHHRFMIKLHLDRISNLEEAITSIESRVESLLEPFRASKNRLMTIPGISDVAAATVLAEIGADMSRFPTAGHLVSWAGLCPRLAESAGKKLSTKLRDGDPWLKPVLVQCAWSVTKKRDCYYHAMYHRIRSRRGHKKALIAVAAAMLTTAYHLLKKEVDYVEPGPNHMQERQRQKLATRLVRRLRELGYTVTAEAA